MSGVRKAYNNTIPEYDEGVKPNMSITKDKPELKNNFPDDSDI